MTKNIWLLIFLKSCVCIHSSRRDIPSSIVLIQLSGLNALLINTTLNDYEPTLRIHLNCLYIACFCGHGAPNLKDSMGAQPNDIPEICGRVVLRVQEGWRGIMWYGGINELLSDMV